MRPTGASIIDHVLGGYPPGLPLVIAGPSGSGRTVLGLQLANSALERGEVVQIDLRRPMNEIRALLSKYPVKTRLSLSGPLIVARDIAHASLWLQIFDPLGKLLAGHKSHRPPIADDCCAQRRNDALPRAWNSSVNRSDCFFSNCSFQMQTEREFRASGFCKPRQPQMPAAFWPRNALKMPLAHRTNWEPWIKLAQSVRPDTYSKP